MKMNVNSMTKALSSVDNKTWRNVGLIALAAGALVYPAMKLYQYIAQRRKAAAETGEETVQHKSFSPAYRGHHKPHRRKAENVASNGHLTDGLAGA